MFDSERSFYERILNSFTDTCSLNENVLVPYKLYRKLGKTVICQTEAKHGKRDLKTFFSQEPQSCEVSTYFHVTGVCSKALARSVRFTNFFLLK